MTTYIVPCLECFRRMHNHTTKYLIEPVRSAITSRLCFSESKSALVSCVFYLQKIAYLNGRKKVGKKNFVGKIFRELQNNSSLFTDDIFPWLSEKINWIKGTSISYLDQSLFCKRNTNSDLKISLCVLLDIKIIFW